MKENHGWIPIMALIIAFLALLNPWAIEIYRKREKSGKPMINWNLVSRIVGIMWFGLVIFSICASVIEIRDLVKTPTGNPNRDALKISIDVCNIFTLFWLAILRVFWMLFAKHFDLTGITIRHLELTKQLALKVGALFPQDKNLEKSGK